MWSLIGQKMSVVAIELVSCMVRKKRFLGIMIKQYRKWRWHGTNEEKQFREIYVEWFH